MSQVAEIKGLKELLTSMRRYPVELAKSVAVNMAASLNVFWESMPAYPPEPPNSTYTRRGTLGKSFGSGMSGGAVGSPSIYRIRQLGAGNFEGQFGSNLEYAPFVVGDTTQAQIHAGRWWQMKDVATMATEKVKRLWQSLADKLAAFLEGKGG